jgi:hypothetical protein
MTAENNKTPRTLRVLRGSAVCFCLSVACGYAPVRKPGQAIRVAAVKNDTAQAEAGGIVATAMRSELAGRRRLASDSSSAPEMSVELLGLRSSPSASGGEGAAAFRLDAEMKVLIGDYEDRLIASEDYLAGVDVLGTEANRRAALRRLATAAAKEAIERYEVAERMAP